MRIAVIGSGISGMGAAWLLGQSHDVTLYEREPVPGGHSRTRVVETSDGPVAVDTGFIVFNYRNYPLLTQLFDHLDVPVAPSDMSFGATISGHGSRPQLEYATRSIRCLLAQPANLLRPAFVGMVRDILRFNREAPAYRDADPSLTLGQCLDLIGVGDWFRNYYLLAMGGAIWSCPLSQMLEFPARTFIRFFANHGLLDPADDLRWYTVQGGSREYVQRLLDAFRGTVRTDAAVQRVERTPTGVAVTDRHGQTSHYDQVVLAAHADQSLAMLANPTPAERDLLGACRTQRNRVILHSDASFMPRSRHAWASWVYRQEGDGANHPEQDRNAISLTYWMNNLQPLATSQPLLVTLNPTQLPREELIHDDWETEHPIFDTAAIAAQGQLETIQGIDRLWFCGAWQRNGFHEDGFASAVNVARQLGVQPPWEKSAAVESGAAELAA